ncbi:MAG: tyrosine--tRNA ligase [Candidatus Ryanbacteria bacterium CG10_big_fil_rev_8_21_14_0_10_43_42]|uniref:Tyrosine--tRNA ligase n=1 Tax=Candidatus Ryanbacteria bacterium CG10_big_fil_rev_8_21_14_0_10_43_42 TaxID=1974864 RepID=A0A2M8KWC8_9BACT|nr:MAG: tyrosine--tRNA ligase [Candidatus Ryanbacteria bacterium CG10_big_fil_rev_8_21_14_0_10_43_42]
MKDDISRRIDDLLARGVDEVIDKEHLRNRLNVSAGGGKALRVKLGIDPTSPHIHLGRAVQLLKLRDFQELGHQIVFIVGDFTGVIGDTSDKEVERPMLAKESVEKNMKTYLKQVGRILDMKKVEVRYNSEWLNNVSYQEITRQANVFSLHDFIGRKNIKDRLDAGKRISLRELLYPLMQGYDSVVIEADVEIGGTDQRFNILAGRTLQEEYGQEPQDIITSNLILGLDGRKMSSSWGNTINITDEPNDMYGKIMSMADGQIIPYFVHCTRIPMNTVKAYEEDMKNATNPRDIKMILAREITALYNGEKKAKEAEEYFTSVFQKKEIPKDIHSAHVHADESIDVVLFRLKLASSKSDARRLIRQGAVSLDGEKISKPEYMFKSGGILRVGKRHMIKVIYP